MALSAADVKTKSGAGFVTITWVYDDPDRPAQLFFELKAEIWTSVQNDLNTASKIGEGFTSFDHTGLLVSAVQYYWVRAKSVDGDLGVFFPADPLNGVVGRELVGVLVVPAVTALSATGGIGVATFSWTLLDSNTNGLGALALDAVEVHAASTNNRASATKVAEGDRTFTVWNGIPAGATRFCWVRPRHTNGTFGDWFPAGATSGQSVTEGAAGSINAGTITGGVIRTAASGSRIQIDSSTKTLQYFDGAAVDPMCYLGDPSVHNTGVFGLNNRDGSTSGVCGSSSFDGGYGVLGVCTSAGSAAIAVRALAASKTYACMASGATYAFYAFSGAYGPFTGSHDALILKDAAPEIGDVMVDVAIVAKNGISDTIAEVTPSGDPTQKCAIGVLASRRPLTYQAHVAALTNVPFAPLMDEYDCVTVNAVGEGQINVCGEGGPIEPGDLLCTSSVPGKAMRQSDDLVHSYTVARAREGADLATADDRAQLACIYLCG